MKKFLPLAIVLLFLVSGPGWARKKRSDEEGGSTRHSHHRHAKGSKSSRGKSGADFKVESEINQTKMTFDFKDSEKGKKNGRSKKRNEEAE